MKIPCETIARMSRLRHSDPNSEFSAFRLESDKLIASNRKLMAIEHVPSIQTVEPLHVAIDDALLEQCRTESQYGGTLELVAAMGMVIGKTTFGYQSGNLAYQGQISEWSRWAEVIACTRTPAKASSGVMVWSADDIALLASASPSGVVEFPKVIDATAMSIVIRDSTTHDWVGFFHPKVTDGKHYSGAVVPGWV